MSRSISHSTIHRHVGSWMCLEQDRQCTYNVTLRCISATTVAVEKQWVLHNLSVCNIKFSWKSAQRKSVFFPRGGRTDMTKVIVAFRNFANILTKEEESGRVKLPSLLTSWNIRRLSARSRNQILACCLYVYCGFIIYFPRDSLGKLLEFDFSARLTF